MTQNKDNIKRIKVLTEDILEYQSVDIENAYTQVSRQINKNKSRQAFIRIFSRVAVILLLPSLLSSVLFSVLYVKQKKQLEQVTYHQVKSAPGTVTRLELPDKSIAWLNSGSTLTYPSVFNDKERIVKLSGEGYFEVESDEEHPFYVTVDDDLKFMAYGTAFNINAYADESYVEAFLERGKIDVISLKKTITLEPEKQALFDKKENRITVSTANPDEKTGWKDGRLVFRNTPLPDVLKKLSKRYNVDIELHKKGNEEYKYYATFTTETIEQILNYLRFTAPIEWSVKGLQQNSDTSFGRQQIDVYLK